MSDKIKYPTGAATELAPAYAATISCDVWNNKTIVTPAQLTGNTTLQLVPDAELEIGAEVTVTFTADGTNRTVSAGSNLLGLSIAVNADKVVTSRFEWNGTKFVHISNIANN